jgi:hypothetical protein
MVVLLSGKAVRISPAPVPGRVLSAEDGYRFVPEPAPDICYDYAGRPAVALRECVIRLTTDPSRRTATAAPSATSRPNPVSTWIITTSDPSPRSERDGAKVAAQATFRPRGCRSSAAPMEGGVDSSDAIRRVFTGNPPYSNSSYLAVGRAAKPSAPPWVRPHSAGPGWPPGRRPGARRRAKQEQPLARRSTLEDAAF